MHCPHFRNSTKYPWFKLSGLCLLHTQQGVPSSSKSSSERSESLIGITCNPDGPGAGDLLTTAVELVVLNGGVKSGFFSLRP